MRNPKGDKAGTGRVWLYGRHAVAAALANPERRTLSLLATKNAADWLAGHGTKATPELVRPADIDRLLPAGAVHQGLALEAETLPRARLKETCAPAESGRPVVVLDQITDPQNIGAIFRSAAAFGARAIIVQDRRTPPLSGALAKAAAGAAESVPCIRAVNIARALEGLQGLGYVCAGLAGEAENDIAALPADAPVALVLGAEGAGLRPLVAKTCDRLVKIPVEARMESLNVSNAAAVALYALTQAGR
ncbi:MAG: 23S rRNA (guanosine(2251)-2'-O)-methyltransferase RlmB [Parvularculaceae bacterium]